MTAMPRDEDDSPPIRISLGGSFSKVFCCENPDGVVTAFMKCLGPGGQS